MKGISTILAMILIVIIVVALIGLTYTFAVGLFQTTTTAATSSTTSVTTNIQKSVYIPYNGATCTVKDASNDFVNFTLQNSGTVQINAGDMGASLDGGDITSVTMNSTANGAISATSLAPGKVMIFSAIVLKGKATRTLTVSAPAGDISYTFTNCPT